MPGGYHTIQVLDTGKVLDIPDTSLEECTAIVPCDDIGSASQHWYILPCGLNGFVKFVSRHSNLCMDVACANFSSGTSIQQYTENNTRAQIFSLDDIRLPLQTFENPGTMNIAHCGFYTRK